MITLDDLHHLRTDPRVKFKTETVSGQTFTIVSYIFADPKLWDLPLALETRGIMFDSTGRCVSRPLHKFFNVGERLDTQLETLELHGAEFIEKRDGSMLIPVLIDDIIYWKSKKSFFSDVAKQASQCATDSVLSLSRLLLLMGYTPVFEFTHPEHRIVIDYGTDASFVLIAVRNVETGEYMSHSEMSMYAAISGVQVVKIFTGRHYTDLLSELDTAKGIEGYVIRHPNGQWTKAKSKWYLINHRIMTELRERDIALAVIEEVVDDMKSAIVAEGHSIDAVLEIESRVMDQLKSIVEGSISLLNQINQEPTQKDAAMKYKNHELFGLAMILYKGKEPNYKDFWKKHHLKQDYSLKTIYNQNFTGEE